MIRITSISELRHETIQYDETWAIVRSLKNPIKGVKQVADLSPTKQLFYSYLNWKKAGIWNNDTFATKYVPAFINGLKANPNAKALLAELVDKAQAGKNICLLCFCPDETLCHRSIIAGLLQGIDGVEVITNTGNDYSKYRAMYFE